MSLATTGNEYAGEITRAAPAVTVSGASLLGFSLNEWVLIATLIYTLLQMGWFIYSKFIRKEK